MRTWPLSPLPAPRSAPALLPTRTERDTATPELESCSLPPGSPQPTPSPPQTPELCRVRQLPQQGGNSRAQPQLPTRQSGGARTCPSPPCPKASPPRCLRRAQALLQRRAPASRAEGRWEQDTRSWQRGRGGNSPALPLAHPWAGLECDCAPRDSAFPRPGQSSPGWDPPRLCCAPATTSTCGLWLGSSSSVFLWFPPISLPFSAGITPRSHPAASRSPSGPRCPYTCSVRCRAMLQPLAEPKPSHGKLTHGKE